MSVKLKIIYWFKTLRSPCFWRGHLYSPMSHAPGRSFRVCRKCYFMEVTEELA